MQLLMNQMVKSVLNSVDIAREKAFEQALSEAEINHIDLCINIMSKSADELSEEIKKIIDFKGVI